MRSLLLVFAIAGCSYFQPKDVEPKNPTSEDELLEQVAERKAKYCELSRDLFAQKKHVVAKCDGLLFAALQSAACGWPELDPWQGEPGQWFRSQEHDCFIPPATDNGANAEFSKDMLAGLLLNSALTKNKQRVTDFLDRTSKNNWFFCDAIDNVTLVSKCWLPETTYKIMADFSGYSLQRDPESGDAIGELKGFQAHLEVLKQLTISAVYGGITESGQKALNRHAERQPENTLYTSARALFTDGDMTGPAREWLKQCPATRLPNSDDWCSDYKYQREKTSGDWGPCAEDPKVLHFGTDCTFAAAVMLGEVR